VVFHVLLSETHVVIFVHHIGTFSLIQVIAPYCCPMSLCVINNLMPLLGGQALSLVTSLRGVDDAVLPVGGKSTQREITPRSSCCEGVRFFVMMPPLAHVF
jgi:hypothetical protein